MTLKLGKSFGQEHVEGEYDGCRFALTEEEIVYYLRLADKYSEIISIVLGDKNEM